MDKKFYITTPIYYPSAKPHMGHAYSSIIADFFARFKRMDGFDVQFLTGTDEHGLKIQRSAEKQNIDPLEFCNQISQTFRDLSQTLNLTNTDFFRTTEDRHKKTVQYLWNELEKNDDIYLSKYSGWYSVSDEAFYNEDEIEDIDGVKRSISSKSPVEWIEEESYFFRLSKWEKPLLDYYESHPNFIAPESRKNEVISFVKSGLKDLSVSRKSFSWGIKVPNNNDHVIYVWLDALTNYISALNYPDTDNNLFKNFWPASIHLIGKDILRFHAVYWPAFLLAAKIKLQLKVYGHGWIISGEEKMSKSKGNILDQIEIINEYGLDPLRYYLIKEVSFGNDGNISQERLEDCINSDLANNFGNLCQRVTAFAEKEACPNNLAPTTSTTAQLVLGDALAVALLEMRSFTSNDFAKYHPGGSLGKKLYLRVHDLLTQVKPQVTIDDTLQDVIIEISSKRLGAAVVLDKTEVVGLVTDGDLRRMLQKTTDLSGITAKNVMTKSPKQIDAHILASEALSLMKLNNITQLIVMENKKYAGLIHLHDILKEGVF